MPAVNNLEQQVIESVSQRLSAKNQRIINQQIKSIQYIQRICKGIECNCFYTRKFPYNLFLRPRTTPVRFSADESEICIARVSLRNPISGELFVCSVWVVDGLLFSFEYDKPPTSLLSESAIVIRVDVHPQWDADCSNNTT